MLKFYMIHSEKRQKTKTFSPNGAEISPSVLFSVAFFSEMPTIFCESHKNDEFGTSKNLIEEKLARTLKFLKFFKNKNVELYNIIIITGNIVQ